MNAVPLASESTFVQAHCAAADVPLVYELVNRARRGQEALRSLARDFVIQAAANGAVYEELRKLFPPRSNWQAWVSAEVGVSVKTITRQRRLAEFVQQNPGLLERLHPDVGVTAAYLLAARDAPRKAVLELAGHLTAAPMGEKQIRHTIEQVRQEERLASLDGRAYDLYLDNEVSLRNALEMAENAPKWPESVQQLIFTHAIPNAEIYPLLTRIWRYQREAFDSLMRSGTIWSSVLEQPIPLREASATDFQLLLREEDAERFMAFLDNARDGEAHDQHKAAARHIGNFSGLLEEIVPELKRLEPGKRYYVTVFEALAE